ncbi:MAG: VOC family protein [Chloroflexota bacterium]
MASYRFDHVHLFSSDPLKTARFYQDVLGATKTGEIGLPDGRTLISLDLTGTGIFVSQPKPRAGAPGVLPDTGLDHFGLKTDDLKAAVAELKAQGVKFAQEITPVAWRPGASVSFFLAPDDTRIELQEGNLP